MGKNQILGVDILIEVAITPNRTIVVDLNEELCIDLDNLHIEWLSQPSKHAWWTLLETLAEAKVDLSKSRMEQTRIELEGTLDILGDRRFKGRASEYFRAYLQYLIIHKTRMAFEHRKNTLIQLMDTSSQQDVLSQYQSVLTSLWAVGA